MPATVFSPVVRSFTVVAIWLTVVVVLFPVTGSPTATIVRVSTVVVSLLPAVTVIGIEFAFLIGGLVVTEQVFNLNGIGQLFVQSVSRNDFTLIQGMVMLIAVVYVFVNLIVDLLYGVFDPRIRYT